MRDIKIQVIFNIHSRDFKPEIMHHYTTVNRLCSKQDLFDYKNTEIIAKRQYTGRNDIEDNEIYEGDILSFGTVVWHQDELAFCVENGGDISLLSNIRHALVIGNIYQSPELLEK